MLVLHNPNPKMHVGFGRAQTPVATAALVRDTALEARRHRTNRESFVTVVVQELPRVRRYFPFAHFP